MTSPWSVRVREDNFASLSVACHWRAASYVLTSSSLRPPNQFLLPYRRQKSLCENMQQVPSKRTPVRASNNGYAGFRTQTRQRSQFWPRDDSLYRAEGREENKLRIFSGTANPNLAQVISYLRSTPLSSWTLRCFQILQRCLDD